MVAPKNRQSVFAMTLPSGGMLTVPISLDFRTATEFECDFTELIQQNHIDFISGVFIDNWDNDEPIVLQMSGSQQRVICPASSQMYAPLLAPNPPVIIASSVNTGVVISAQFYNIPLLPMIIRKDAGGGFNLPAGGEVGQVLGLVGVSPYVLGWFDLGPTPPPTGFAGLLIAPTGEDYLTVAPTGDDYLTYEP